MGESRKKNVTVITNLETVTQDYEVKNAELRIELDHAQLKVT